MKHINLLLISIAFALFLAPILSNASELKEGEIYYGTVQEQVGAETILHYQSPAGDSYFKCDLETLGCNETEESEKLLKKELYIPNWWNDPDGRYSLHTIRYSPTVLSYRLYELEDGDAVGGGTLITLNKQVMNVFFSNDGSALVMLTQDGTMYRYDIKETKLTSNTLPEKSWRLLSASPEVSFIGGFSDYASKYTLVNTKTGASTIINSSSPSTLRFSQTGKYAAWLTSENGEARVTVGQINSDMSVSVVNSRVNSGTTVFDFIFVGEKLYTIANTNNPYSWHLFSYDPETGEKKTISEDASYNQELVSFKDYLLYATIDGNVSAIYRLDTQSGVVGDFELTPESEEDVGLERSSITLADGRLHAAVIEPSKESNQSLPLILWLHGGPYRQTSVGYHSYFSYGVYDELLERLAGGGARVLKLDYTGSWGYGEVFKNALTGNVGVKDIADVETAIKEVQKRYKTSEVYVIGNSYGGYLAMKAAVDLPDLVDAIVSVNGVSDWYDLIDRIPSSPFTLQFGGVPNATTLPAYKSATIVTKAKDADNDPMLIVYGNEDTTVPPRQSELFIAAANLAKKNVEALVLEGEGHVLKKRSSLDELCEEVASTFDLEPICR